MTRRLVAVLVPAASSAADGFPGEELRLAMVEDVYETIAALELVEPVLVVAATDPARDALADLLWPGTPLVDLPDEQPPRAAAAVAALARMGADQATVVAGDAPDLPGLLVGKLHRGLGSADVSVLPAAEGGLVALSAHCPQPAWTAPDRLDLDAADAVQRLHQSAPRRGAVHVGPGWHRVRSRDDLARLDPGLEGWDATRARLSAPS